MGLISALLSEVVAPIKSAIGALANRSYENDAIRQQVENQQKQLDYQARVNQAQAQILSTQANSIMEESRANERTLSDSNRRLLAQQEALMAGAGMAIEGSPLEILGLTAIAGQKDLYSQRRQGELGWQKNAFDSKSLLDEAESFREYSARLGDWKSDAISYNNKRAMMVAGVGFGSTVFAGGSMPSSIVESVYAPVGTAGDPMAQAKNAEVKMNQWWDRQTNIIGQAGSTALSVASMGAGGIASGGNVSTPSRASQLDTSQLNTTFGQTNYMSQLMSPSLKLPQKANFKFY